MAEQLPVSRCGIDCNGCTFRITQGCPGCVATKGKLFWGDCAIAACSINKGLHHCGQCDEFPCDELVRFSYDPEQGDNGERIRNLENIRNQE